MAGGTFDGDAELDIESVWALDGRLEKLHAHSGAPEINAMPA
jgi:hypothetical protein